MGQSETTEGKERKTERKKEDTRKDNSRREYYSPLDVGFLIQLKFVVYELQREPGFRLCKVQY